MDELISASLRDTCEFAHGNGQRVHGNGDGLSMEVAGRDDHVLVRENVGIVRGGVDFVLQHGLHIRDIVLHGAVYLRDAAEAVRVLHMFFGAADELASFQDLHVFFAGKNLPLVRAQMMGEGKERFNAAVESVQGHGADKVGPAAQARALEDAPDSVRAHELRPVQQGQPLLALQPDRLPAQFFPYVGRGTDLSFV